MGTSYMTAPLIFLINTLFSLYIFAIILRFLLQWNNADFYNPISQFLVKATHPPLKVLRRFVPSVGKIDTSSIVLALGLEMIVNFLTLMLSGVLISIAALIVMSFAKIVEYIISIFIIAVFLRAIFSWFHVMDYNPAIPLLHTLTEPLLNMCRKVMPDLGGVDFSPLVALIILQLARMMILPPLNQLASFIG